MLTNKMCNKCKTENVEEAKFCDFCGYSLEIREKEDTGNYNESKLFEELEENEKRISESKQKYLQSLFPQKMTFFGFPLVMGLFFSIIILIITLNFQKIKNNLIQLDEYYLMRISLTFLISLMIAYITLLFGKGIYKSFDILNRISNKLKNINIVNIVSLYMIYNFSQISIMFLLFRKQRLLKSLEYYLDFNAVGHYLILQILIIPIYLYFRYSSSVKIKYGKYLKLEFNQFGTNFLIFTLVKYLDKNDYEKLINKIQKKGNNSKDVMIRLTNLKALYDAKEITDSEYSRERSRILGEL
ncbi:MAG: zinc ribbon domain-containing protein [Ignavibacteriae bacterium]|nr:zinc ribbon domain-containing protein [Ignavibacteriota bacterium]